MVRLSIIKQHFNRIIFEQDHCAAQSVQLSRQCVHVCRARFAAKGAQGGQSYVSISEQCPRGVRRDNHRVALTRQALAVPSTGKWFQWGLSTVFANLHCHKNYRKSLHKWAWWATTSAGLISRSILAWCWSSPCQVCFAAWKAHKIDVAVLQVNPVQRDLLTLMLNVHVFGETIDDMRQYAEEHTDKVDIYLIFLYKHILVGGTVSKRNRHVLSTAHRSGWRLPFLLRMYVNVVHSQNGTFTSSETTQS